MGQENNRHQKAPQCKPKTPRQPEKPPTPKSTPTQGLQGADSPFVAPLLPPGAKTPKTDQRRATPTCRIERQTEPKKKATPQAKKPPIDKTPIGNPIITLTPTT